MNIKSASWKSLTGESRLIARIERIARNNTIFGGASAMVLVKRLVNLGGTDLRHVVSDVYSASTGNTHSEHGAFECPECGTVHLGRDNAAACCSENFNDVCEE